MQAFVLYLHVDIDAHTVNLMFQRVPPQRCITSHTAVR